MLTRPDPQTQRYALLALVAAALFGVSAPLAKVLGVSVAPVMLAGLLYLGSGTTLALFLLVRHLVTTQPGERALRRADLGWLLGSVLLGGGVAPVLLMWGLSHTTGAIASLLLGMEGVLTALIAAGLFRESIGQRVWWALALMLLASGMLAAPGQLNTSWLGVLAVAGACLCWALDNNLTRPIAEADPVQIAAIKGLLAGSVNLGLALVTGQAWPDAWHVSLVLGMGALSYGISLVLFILALRHLGSARTGAHFGTAPFFGAAFALLVLGEPLTWPLTVALGLMLLATWLVLTEQHRHAHHHEALLHEHWHEHDLHHQHEHAFEWDPTQPHSHVHAHQALTHEHAHLPDLHHRHGHD